MPRNERHTCNEVIEPAMRAADWEFDANVEIGRGRVNLTGPSMYDENQKIVADYVLRYWHVPLAILEAKAHEIGT